MALEIPTAPGENANGETVGVARLFASKITYRGNLLVAEGAAQNPVRFGSALGRLRAARVQLDTQNRVVEASGNVQLERDVSIERRQLRARAIGRRFRTETFTESLSGENLRYDFGKSQGSLENARLQTSSAAFETSQLQIDGPNYAAKNVILRPGALSEAERKIYGTPPLNIRARELSLNTQSLPGQERIAVRDAALYFKKTRLIPLPAYAFRVGNRDSDPSAVKLTPDISFNSADRIFVSGTYVRPLNENPDKLSLELDLGLSQRVGIRGGATLRSRQDWGIVRLEAQKSDVITSQLTNRIELDRFPELSYQSPAFATFALPGGRRAGLSVETSYGRFNERTIGESESKVESDRLRGRILFSTRLSPADGVYLRAYRVYSRYNRADRTYGNTGVEIGYDGPILSRVRGQISLRLTSLSGETPFRFDRVEIGKEIRTTVDIELTPRYLVPLDLRYDLSRDKVRDSTFGILRSYKVFAYGVVYQTARRELRLEVRSGF